MLDPLTTVRDFIPTIFRISELTFLLWFRSCSFFTRVSLVVLLFVLVSGIVIIAFFVEFWSRNSPNPNITNGELRLIFDVFRRMLVEKPSKKF